MPRRAATATTEAASTASSRRPSASPDASFATDESAAHSARKALFARALAQGFLAREDLDAALPSGALSGSERWLLHYSLRAANIEVLERAAVPSP